MQTAIYFGTVFLAGIVSFFSACIIPLLPVYIGILSDNQTNDKKINIGKMSINLVTSLKSLVFVAGIASTFIFLGFGAGAIGSIINNRYFLMAIGGFVILLGLHQIGLFHLTFLEREKKVDIKRSRKNDLWGTFLLGLSFSFGWTPCVGPILGAVIGITASKGQALYGGLLMLVYSLGLAIPFFVISVFADILLKKVKGIQKHMGKIKIAGGVLIIIMGLFLMTGQLGVITATVERWLQ